ncbi:hypothetical protein [Halalkalibacter krulwichiae]|uniref:Uncharacterized protein n=1 Tax=Halalkalibacter krulwichiae TaxID=199441 RepID=A0A1X9MHC6_9BACI|nr:hypothetical protein [Halalkalibacter krulwichiae]ARK32826.1 hypothetical protein BkAM31D_24810 [Halalkalibacter krulwichiae]
MKDTNWSDWQKKIIQQEYVEPDITIEKIKSSIEKINQKYSHRYVAAARK